MERSTVHYADNNLFQVKLVFKGFPFSLKSGTDRMTQSPEALFLHGMPFRFNPIRGWRLGI